MATDIQRKTPLNLLSEDELKRIHASTLEILEGTGVRFLCQSALNIFAENSLKVDNNQVVYFPPHLVEQCLKSVPSSFTRFPRNSTYRPVRLGNGTVYFGTGSTTAYVLDLEGKYREATERDTMNFARLSDAMDNLPIGNGMIWAQDIPKSVFHARYFEVLAKNNGKVIPAGDGLNQKITDDLIRLSSIVCGGSEEIAKKKTFTMTACPQQALTWSEEVTVAIEAAKVKLPFEPCPMPLMGSMHPVTLAGALVQMNAELLSGLVLNQLVNPGAPVIYMVWPGMMDMSVASNIFGCPEQALLSAAAAQMARWYQIPSNIIVGQTDSKIPDQQAGYEKMMSMLLVALAGADEIALVGGLIDFGRTANYEQVVIDNEIAGYIQRILKGIEVTEDKLALDVIREVAHGGSYLAHEHTLRHFREEQYFTQLSDRNMRGIWRKNNSQDIRERAIERARKILKEHHPAPLSREVQKDLEKEVAVIYQREGVKYIPAEVG